MIKKTSNSFHIFSTEFSFEYTFCYFHKTFRKRLHAKEFHLCECSYSLFQKKRKSIPFSYVEIYFLLAARVIFNTYFCTIFSSINAMPF